MPNHSLTIRTMIVSTFATGLASLFFLVTPASALVGAYANWTVASGSGTMNVPGASSFPTATLTTNATNAVSRSGASTWLNTNTPIGAVYGSSQNQPYLSVNTATGQAPSTTALTFASATPVGNWSFAVGDIDADTMTITGTTTGGVPLTAAQLGFQGTFNFCGSSPKPSSCGTGFATDLPTWDPATFRVIGSGTDTDGASAWFTPTVPVESLTFVFTRLIGIPVGFIWIASETGAAPTTTTEAPTTTTTEAPTTTTEAPTTAAPSTEVPTTADPTVSGSSATGAIANTGAGTEGLFFAGNACVLAGGAMIGSARVIRRRRRRSDG